jgi:hypothetical protein
MRGSGISIVAATFLLLWLQWRTGGIALPLPSVYDVNNTTPLSSCAHLIQNTKEKREESKERALIEQGEG